MNWQEKWQQVSARSAASGRTSAPGTVLRQRPATASRPGQATFGAELRTPGPSFGFGSLGYGRAEFGTNWLGNHTGTDLDDLIKAKDSEIADLTTAVSQSHPSGPLWAAWIVDWKKYLADYRDVTAEGRIAGGMAAQFIANHRSAEDLYQKVLRVLQPQGFGTVGPFGDLLRRFQALPGAATVQFRHVPQPTTADTSESWFSALDSVTRAMPDPLKDLVAKLAPNYVPKTADAPNYKPENVVPWWLWPAALVGGLFAIALVIKSGPLSIVSKVV